MPDAGDQRARAGWAGQLSTSTQTVRFLRAGPTSPVWAERAAPTACQDAHCRGTTRSWVSGKDMSGGFVNMWELKSRNNGTHRF